MRLFEPISRYLLGFLGICRKIRLKHISYKLHCKYNTKQPRSVYIHVFSVISVYPNFDASKTSTLLENEHFIASYLNELFEDERSIIQSTYPDLEQLFQAARLFQSYLRSVNVLYLGNQCQLRDEALRADIEVFIRFLGNLQENTSQAYFL